MHEHYCWRTLCRTDQSYLHMYVCLGRGSLRGVAGPSPYEKGGKKVRQDFGLMHYIDRFPPHAKGTMPLPPNALCSVCPSWHFSAFPARSHLARPDRLVCCSTLGCVQAHRRQSLLVNAEGLESPIATSPYGMSSGPNSAHGLPTSPFRRGLSQGPPTPTGLMMGFELSASAGASAAGSTTGSDAEEIAPVIKIPEIRLTQAWGAAGEREPGLDSGMESEDA